MSQDRNRSAMMSLLKIEAAPLTWVDYCAMPPVNQLVWEGRGNELNKAMLYLMNLRRTTILKRIYTWLILKEI